MLKRYLIAQYFPGAGQTEENPACYIGTGSYVIDGPDLPEYIKEQFCYKTRPGAERYAMKCNFSYRYSRFAVKEIILTGTEA